MARTRAKVYSSSKKKTSRRRSAPKRHRRSRSSHRMSYSEPMYAPVPPPSRGGGGIGILGSLLTLLVFAAIGFGIYVAVTPGVSLAGLLASQTTTAAAESGGGFLRTLGLVIGFGLFGAIMVFGGREVYNRYIGGIQDTAEVANAEDTAEKRLASVDYTSYVPLSKYADLP